MKYVFVTDGDVSGLGKGVTATSIGVLLKACGLRVTYIKIDPYLDMDAGIISPYEHGEVLVMDDGGEVELDLGNYERFLDIKLTRDHTITSEKVYQSVTKKERRGDYLGKKIQIVPHITDAIQEWIERVAKIPVDGQEGPSDVCVVEFGGTIGDIESMAFVEAIGQFSYRVGPGNFCLIHNTEGTQHSVRKLRRLGLAPDMLACRSTMPLKENVKTKLSQFCHVPGENIITVFDFPNIWDIPLLLRDQKAHEAILKVLNLKRYSTEPVLDEWTQRARRSNTLKNAISEDSLQKYLSLIDIERLTGYDLAIENSVGEYLAKYEYGYEDMGGYSCVKPNADGSLPQHAVFPITGSSVNRNIFTRETLRSFKEKYFERNLRKKVSAGLSDFLWSSDSGDIQVEFRSPIAGFPPNNQLRVVYCNKKGSGQRIGPGDEFCLVACGDGKVKWLPESVCVNGDHVWTIHLFEHRNGDALYLRNELRRIEPKIYNNCVMNTYIGGNVNGSGTQTIGHVKTMVHCLA